MLFSCYLLQARFKGATPLAPTALPLAADSRAPTMLWEPCGSADGTRETGQLGFRVHGGACPQSANADRAVRFRAYVRYRRALRDDRRMHACGGGQRMSNFIMESTARSPRRQARPTPTWP